MAEKIELEFTLIFCEFDEHLGPIPRLSYPKINKDFALQIKSDYEIESVKFIRLYDSEKSIKMCENARFVAMAKAERDYLIFLKELIDDFESKGFYLKSN